MTVMEMSQVYTPLEPGSIRLLEMCDDTGLCCNLAPFQLQNAPPFIALSYTWGKAAYQKGRPSDQQYTMSLNGRQVSIQQNLHDAINTLAKDVRQWRGRCYLFWVDFVCINQFDLEERSCQVALMKDIYEKSTVIFAWLGLPYDEEETRLAVKLMQSFNEYLRKGLETQNNDIDAVTAGIDSSTPGFPSTEGGDEWKAWMGIAEMMQRSYWTRTWIYQEATTPGEIWFYCGRESFNDIHLAAASTFGTQFSLNCPDFDAHFADAVGLASDMSRLSSARIRREKGQDRNLLTLVEEVRNTTCSDERDKIYAPLAHAADTGTEKIVVDYTKDVEIVFGDLVRFEIVNNIRDGLGILNYAYVPAPDASNEFLREVIDPSWPSWIPDWRQKVSLLSFYSVDRGQSLLSNPCPGTQIAVEFYGNTMSVKGFTLKNSPIAYLTQICENDRDVTGLTKGWHAEMIESGASEQTDESVRRSLVADAGIVENDPGGDRYYTRGYMVDWSTVDQDYNMSSRISNVCLGRRMGMTDSGRFIGIFPAAAQKGDVVAAFHGGHLLYLLRPVSEHEHTDLFRFIGSCYVDGLMDGEAAPVGTAPRMLHLI